MEFGLNLDLVALAFELDEIIERIQKGETHLAKSYVSLGIVLFKIRSKRSWADEFKSFGDFIESVKERIKIGRTQIYQYVSTVEKLLPSMSETDLEAVGISKAIELQRIVLATGNRPPKELVDKALDPCTTREEIKGAVFELLNVKSQAEKGTYRDLGGFYATEDEWKEVSDAFTATEHTDPFTTS